MKFIFGMYNQPGFVSPISTDEEVKKWENA